MPNFTRRRRVAKRNSRSAQPRPVFATVVSVADGVALAELEPGGRQFEIYEMGGWLPQPGAKVALHMNGGDPISGSPGRLVSGSMESGDGYDDDADTSWGLDATGFFRARGAEFEGTVTAREFRTRADFTEDGGIQINSDAYNKILLRRPGPLEDDPAALYTTYDNETLPGVPITLVILEGAADEYPSDPPQLSLRQAATFSEASLFGDTFAQIDGGGNGVSCSGAGVSIHGTIVTDVDIDGSLAVNALTIAGKPVQPSTASRATFTADTAGDITIAHGLGVVCTMHLTIVTPTLDWFGGSLHFVEMAASTTANRFRCKWGDTAVPNGTDITVAWTATPT